ncbi:MAG: 2Fe-2S iron-sulfur cluster binding domain-containing protein [Alphaproteobacteria bacterium]|nr:2Fe-2S iron-sulfur cluster binding domain-containing protein [Alphaproteobacteria bacterium]
MFKIVSAVTENISSRPAAKPGKPRFSVTIRGLRLGTGLILFAYVITHLANHALGLISLEAMEAGREYFLLAWRNPVGSILLVGSLLLHMILALDAVYRRRRLKMSIGEALQLTLGFAAPILLVSHILGTRAAVQLYGTDDTYAYVLLALWVDDPTHGIKQTSATVIIWIHACIGIYYWLRLKPWFVRSLAWLYGLALMVPVLGLLGFVNGGRAVGALVANDPGFRLDIAIDTNSPTAEQAAELGMLEDRIFIFLAALLIGTLIARAFRLYTERRRGVVRITYPAGRIIETAPGSTILEASVLFDVPHASVCGGRGRCSTCRVRINGGLELLPEPSEQEQKVLRRVKAAPDVRLACQLRPTADISVTPLLPANANPRDGFAKTASTQGQEQEIAILFADIRGFTTLSEQKLPYDVVFILNRYFRSMGEAIEGAGGRVDKFIGDGIMALFGVDQSAEQGCKTALQAARTMAERLDELNDLLKADLPTPLRIGIGIHVGPAIVGEMGYARATSITAIGDTVNTASRLESKTKDYGAQLIISQRVAELGGIEKPPWPSEDTEVRGRQEPMRIYILDDARQLPERSGTPARQPATTA